MKYTGKLYGKIGRRHIPLTMHSDQVDKMAPQIRTLLHCLVEEMSANNGSFASSDTDTIFRLQFCDWEDGNKTTKEALESLLTAHEGQHTQN